jgi:acyl carrier protein
VVDRKPVNRRIHVMEKVADTAGEQMVEKVCAVIADVFGVPGEELGAATVQEDIPEWDSLGHLNLMLALEEAFSVSFSVDEMPELTSVKAIVEKVR